MIVFMFAHLSLGGVFECGLVGVCARVCVSVSVSVCVQCSDGLWEEAVSEYVGSCLDGPVAPARG